MSVSNISFSASILPFYQTSGSGSNFSNTNLSATGNLSIDTVTDASTGQKNQTVTSSLLSNGVSYVSNGSSQNGDLLTVNYISTNATQDSGTSAGLLNTDISGQGVNFLPDKSTTYDDTVRTSYNINPNIAYTAPVENAAITSENSDTDEDILLQSFSQVGDNISVTYQVSNGSLSSNTKLATSQVPEQTPSSGTVGSNLGAGAAPTFAAQGYSNIADLLADASGQNDSGTIGNALQTANNGTASNTPSSAVLANALNPSFSSTPQAVSVGNFIDTNLNAFPTASVSNNSNNANASQAYNAASNFSSGNVSSAFESDSNYSNRGNGSDSNNGNSNGYGATSYTNNADTGASVGIYSALSNANTSTIRGTGLNAIA